MEKELVNHPMHYNKEGRKECIDEMQDIFGTEFTIIWAIMTAYKYRYRIGEKDDVEQERGKICWYEDWAKEHIKPHHCIANEIKHMYLGVVKE